MVQQFLPKWTVLLKKVMDASAAARVAKRRNERKELLQRQLSRNTAKMNVIKKSINQ